LRLAVPSAVGLGFLAGIAGASPPHGISHDRTVVRAASVCRVPRLTGLVVFAARERAAKAGCRLRLEGEPVERAAIQTIGEQSPRPGMRSQTITAWVNSLCSGSAAWGPLRGEPFLTPGPTELVSGLYLDGGPHLFRSAPRCDALSGTPGAGTIMVMNAATGATVATQTVVRGRLAAIPLPPGTYSVRGTFGEANTNGVHPQSFPVTVQIESGKTLRRDLVLNIS
jgi:hypothetical protein